MVGVAWMAAYISSFASGRPVFAPALLLAGVNLTAEVSSEPPRGGEHGAGENCLYLKSPFAESRNCSDYSLRELHTCVKANAAGSGRDKRRKEAE